MIGIEPIPRPLTGRAQFVGDLSATAIVNAVIGFLFAASGPVAIILSVGSRAGLNEALLASWIFGSFFINGILSMIACWLYRTPLVFFWTIPGTVLLGPALEHLSFAEVIGAYYASGFLMLVLGLSGWLRRLMQALPMPVVMGMVAGVFLQFGLDWVRSVHADVWLAGLMTLVFLLLSITPRLGRWLPPLIGALIVGALVIVIDQRFDVPSGVETSDWLITPTIIVPEFSSRAMFELVVPLAITVLMVQNGQGIAVLRNAGHSAPVNFIASACGVWSMIAALFGTVSTCLTGPTNALISSSGKASSHYTAGVLVGALALIFGLFAPAFTRWMLAAPSEFIATLAGLAMLRVLQTAFTSAFAGPFSLGALVSFLVTVSEISIWNIGAPFWGLLIGYVISRLMEPPV